MSYLSFKEAIRQALLADAAVAALVGDRVAAAYAPRFTTATGPWIVINQVSGEEQTSQDGNDYLSRPRFQLTIGGTDPRQVDQVRDLLVYGFNGAQYVQDGRTVTFFYADDSDAWEDNPRIHLSRVDFYVWANTQQLGD